MGAGELQAFMDSCYKDGNETSGIFISEVAPLNMVVSLMRGSRI